MRISVVTPNLNGAEYLEETITSVITAARRAAGRASVEYIVADGGSTDASGAIIDRHRDGIARVIDGPDRGQYDAVAAGFRASTGDVLAWLNSDDVYLPWALATVASVMEALPEVEWMTTLSPGAMDADGLAVQFRSVPGYCARAFHDGMYLPFEGGRGYGAIQQESCFWRRSLWERAGGNLDDACSLAADFELWSRFFAQAKLYAVAAPLAVYRYRPGQRSSDETRYVAEARAVLQRIGGAPSMRTALRAAPVVRDLLAPVAGYPGSVAVRSEGTWKIHEYRFL